MSLRFALHSTMLSGIRKFCDYHFVGQFLPECIVDMLTDGLIVTAKQRCQLLAKSLSSIPINTYKDNNAVWKS